MYKFEQYLPFLPQDYRRKLTYSVCYTHSVMQQEPEGWELADVMQIDFLHSIIHNREMYDLERLGNTNTRLNPFDL